MINDLMKFGLTKGEAKVYLALINGEKTKSDIVKEAGVSKSIIYEILDKLMKKGLASSYLVNGIKNYQANNPEILIEKEEELIKEKRRIAKEKFALIKVKGSEGKKSLFANTYEGLNGLKNLLKDVEEEFLRSNIKEWLATGVTTYKEKSFNRLWIKWHKDNRAKLGVKAKFIFSEKNTNYSRRLSKSPLSESKYMQLKTPSCITITGNLVLIMKYSDKPKFILINNKDVAETFKELFNTQWRTAK